MTFEEAVRKSMRAYWEDTDDFDQLETSKNRKYNKKYFDSVEEEMLPKKDQSKELPELKTQKTGKVK